MKIREVLSSLYEGQEFIGKINGKEVLFTVVKRGYNVCGEVKKINHIPINRNLLEQNFDLVDVLDGEYELAANCKTIDNIDWSKVPRDVKVNVKNNKYDTWERAYFISYSEDIECKFMATQADKWCNNYGALDKIYKYCRIDESVKIKDGWYK
ncbi:MAG: hypothetical protein ACRC28_18645 [Clostridium sp.]|uniref:hypothetical protein n=1 Tax=Clostridium sp. TaxID=1506 RepID=UPI003F4049DD